MIYDSNTESFKRTFKILTKMKFTYMDDRLCKFYESLISLHTSPLSLSGPPELRTQLRGKGREKPGEQAALTGSQEDEDRPAPSHHLRAKSAGQTHRRRVRRSVARSSAETLQWAERESRCFSSRCGLAPPPHSRCLCFHWRAAPHLSLLRYQEVTASPALKVHKYCLQIVLKASKVQVPQVSA